MSHTFERLVHTHLGLTQSPRLPRNSVGSFKYLSQFPQTSEAIKSVFEYLGPVHTDPGMYRPAIEVVESTEGSELIPTFMTTDLEPGRLADGYANGVFNQDVINTVLLLNHARSVGNMASMLALGHIHRHTR